ncbi:RHD3-domain-containing protein [Athelia psychrophila]|uniref:RHD3-domain-containing protein n=1 Tax=Athelia psychrophila TaxID=1759441 RepID=A0A166ADU0_9AGAM|nr:RHD3-domain-containing protein [Fibularhizoctonia sp. CBS 109695]
MSSYPPLPSLEWIASLALSTSGEAYNLDPMSLDSIVHAESPTTPEPTEDARDRVHIHTSREDWMRFQVGEEQCHIPEATSSSGSAPEAIDKHARFFLPAENIYFSIENTLYSVPRLTEDKPLILEDVKAAHFDHLLSILYPSEYGSAIYTASTVDEWTAILHLAVRWGFQSIKTLAISQLTPIATDIDKIALGRQYEINPWLHEAFTAVCIRERSLTKEEGRRMSVNDIIDINAIRQLYRPAAQLTQVSTLSIGESCAGFDLLQFVSLPEPAMPPVSEEAGSAEKSREAAALVLGQLKHLRTSCLIQFKKEMLDGLKSDNYRFASVVAKAKERSETRFKTSAQEDIVEGTGWTWDDEMNLLSNDITSVGDRCRKDETKKMLDHIERNFKQQISEPVDSALNTGDYRMWDQVLTSFEETLEKAESTYLAKAKSFKCRAEDNSTAQATLRKWAWLALRVKIDERTADAVILSKLRGHFEKRFRYDEHGVPSVWKPLEDIDGAFKTARDQTLELLQLYSKISPVEKSHFDFDNTLTIFTEKKKLHLAAIFRRDAHVYYFDAKHSAVASIVSILGCVCGVLVVLSFRAVRYCLIRSLALTAKFCHDADPYYLKAKCIMVASIAMIPVCIGLTAKFRRDADVCYVVVKSTTVASIATIPMWMKLTTKFSRGADACYVAVKRNYVEVKRSTVAVKRSTFASIATIPVWMYGVLVVPGRDEAMAALSSPYIVVQLNLVGPIFSIVRRVGGEVQRQCRKYETKIRLNLIERNFKQQIDSALDKADPRMWDQVLTSFKITLKNAESTHLAMTKSCNFTAEENNTALAILRKQAWLALRTKIDEQTADAVILSKLRGHFEKRFRYNDHGVPRVWKIADDFGGPFMEAQDWTLPLRRHFEKRPHYDERGALHMLEPGEDIDSAFKKAQDQTLKLLQLYSEISPVDKSLAYILPPDAALTVFTEDKKLILTVKFRRDAKECYVTVTGSTFFKVKPSTFAVVLVLVLLCWEALVLL